MEAYLYIEAHIDAIESATNFTYSWCKNMGMSENEAARFTLAVDELLTDMILFAYPDDDGYIELWYRYSVPQLEIIIQESGEPFDPDNYQYSIEKALQNDNFEGAGLELVRRLTDHFLFINRGKQGKEFRLVKELEEQNLAGFRENGDGDKPEKADKSHSFTLTPVTKEDAEDIAKLIYRSYEYTYSKEDLYFPKQNELAIEHGKKFGVMARTEAGHPAGYFSVIKDPDSLVGEVAEAVVSPPYRKEGLMTRMLNELIARSKKRGLQGLYGLALTVHLISQKVNQKYGFTSTALLVAVTKGAKYKSFIEDYPQPVSLLVDFLPLRKRWQPTVYLPLRYHAVLEQLYQELGANPLFEDEIKPHGQKTDETDLDLKFTYRNRTARILVNQLGNSFITSVKSVLRSLHEMDLTAVYIDLPLQQGSVEQAVEWLHEHGFILAGLMPMKYSEADFLRLQKIMVPINFDLIQTHSDTANLLKEFISEEYHEVYVSK